MDLDPSKLLLVWPDLLHSATTNSASSAAVIHMQDNPATSTLTATSTVLESSSVDVGLSCADDQSPPKPRFASVQGNTGQLSYSYPLSLAPGPKGTVPQLAMAYSSAATNGRTSPRSPAENVGEGWALKMGSVTEEKEGGGSIWYFLNGVDNVRDRLIPDSSTVQAGTNFATEHLSYVKVQMVDAGFDSEQLEASTIATIPSFVSGIPAVAIQAPRFIPCTIKCGPSNWSIRSPLWARIVVPQVSLLGPPPIIIC